MNGWLEGRKRALLRGLSHRAPSPSFLPWPGKPISNHKMTLMEYVSDQTVPQSADSLPWRPRVPLELPRSSWEGTRGSQGGQYAVCPSRHVT